MASFVAESREQGLHSTACTFDIAQFFPSLSHEGCALILGRFGFNKSLIKILNSYFTGRTTQYKWDSATSASFDFNVGTPQGDCISPILSAIYLAAGLKIATPLPFPPPNVRSLFFVDDGLLYCASKKPAQNVQRIETCLNRIQDTLATLSLLIEVDKTELIPSASLTLTTIISLYFLCTLPPSTSSCDLLLSVHIHFLLFAR